MQNPGIVAFVADPHKAVVKPLDRAEKVVRLEAGILDHDGLFDIGKSHKEIVRPTLSILGHQCQPRARAQFLIIAEYPLGVIRCLVPNKRRHRQAHS